MNDNIITQLGYSIEKSISGYYRLIKTMRSSMTTLPVTT